MRGSVWLRPCLSSTLELLNLLHLLLLYLLQRQRQRVRPHHRHPRLSRCPPQSRLRWLNR